MGRAGLSPWLCLAAACAAFWAVSGCNTPELRLPSSDEDNPNQVQTVGSAVSVHGMHTRPVRLYGVGIVVGLNGTGGNPEPGPLRLMAIRELKSRGVDDPAQFLLKRDVAVVSVSAWLPPGVRKGEPLDVDVELEAQDQSTSLRGGYLMECELREYADRAELSGGKMDTGLLKGKVFARAEGPLLVGVAQGNAKESLRRGRIWAGAHCTRERNFVLVINKPDVRTAKLVADRINKRFHEPFNGTMRGMAEAKEDDFVTLRVPGQYRHNWPRYLRVIRQIPLREGPGGRAQHELELAEQLLDPSLTVTAALKLEALGTDNAATLKTGLRSPEPLVRFCSAEALAYLGDPACAEPLAELCEKEPEFRAFGLTALASLNESVCHVQLRRLLASSSAETRYGAFQALWTLDANDAAIPGACINDSFHLHQVAPDGAPLVHIAMTRRAEIVLFGEGVRLVPPFSLQAGPEFVVTARDGDEQCFVSRISLNHGGRKETCALELRDIIKQLGDMGATYADVVGLIEAAAQFKYLSCPVAVDALPQAPSVYRLAARGIEAKADADLDAGEDVDLGMTPNLFALPGKRATRGNGE